MKKEVVDKKTLVIVGVGIVVATTLILSSVLKKDEKSNISSPEVIVQNKSGKLAEEDQIKLKPVNDLINAVVDRFEDSISKERAKSNSKVLIKEFIAEVNEENKLKNISEIDNWGKFIEQMTSDRLKEWNKKQEEQFSVELKKLTEDKEVKNIPVEEIAQNNPLYILQEKKIIQRELFEQWLLRTKEEDLSIDPNKALEVKNEKDANLVNEKENTPLAIIPVPKEDDKKEVDRNEQKVKDMEKENKTAQNLKDELEKAQAVAKELDAKKIQLNEELDKNNKSLKDIEEEIKKTKNELNKLDKDLKDINSQK